MADQGRDLDVTTLPALPAVSSAEGIMATFIALWRSRGAEFITEPKKKYGETRCYIRDPDGYIIEVGQSTLGRTTLKVTMGAATSAPRAPHRRRKAPAP